MSGLPSRAETSPFVLRFIQNSRHENTIHILDEYAWEFQVLGGLIQRVRRAATAYLLLEKRGYPAEGRILVRGALEHAITAHLTPDGLDRLEVSMLTSRHAYARSTAREDDDPEWTRLLKVLGDRIPRSEGGQKSKRPSLPKFTGCEGILTELDGTGYFRRAYTVLSRVNHVTDEAPHDYFVNDQDTLGVAGRPEMRFVDDAFPHACDSVLSRSMGGGPPRRRQQ